MDTGLRPSVWVGRKTPSVEVGLSSGSLLVLLEKTAVLFWYCRLSTMVDTCTCAGDGFGHELHCGEVEPAPGGVVPKRYRTSTDTEDLEF
jgi:hypothetical protein